MTAALEGGEWSAARPGRTLPRERLGTHFTGGWVGPTADIYIYIYIYIYTHTHTHAQSTHVVNCESNKLEFHTSIEIENVIFGDV